MAVTKPSVRLIKQFPYRGTTRDWSNRYYLDGHVPSTETEWTDLIDALALVEKTIYGDRTHIVEGRGYLAGSDVAVHTQTMSIAGVQTGGTLCPGDCAVFLRQATTKTSTKNHTVYVFSYYHDVRWNNSDPDVLLANHYNNAEAFGNDLVSGLAVGANTYYRCTPDGHRVTGAHAPTYVGHRDFVN